MAAVVEALDRVDDVSARASHPPTHPPSVWWRHHRCATRNRQTSFAVHQRDRARAAGGASARTNRPCLPRFDRASDGHVAGKDRTQFTPFQRKTTRAKSTSRRPSKVCHVAVTAPEDYLLREYPTSSPKPYGRLKRTAYFRWGTMIHHRYSFRTRTNVTIIEGQWQSLFTWRSRVLGGSLPASLLSQTHEVSAPITTL